MRDELPQGWAGANLSTIFNFKYGKALPKEKRSNNGAVRVYGSNGVVGVHNSAITTGPTIIVGRKGSVGEVHLSSDRCWPIDTTYFIDEFRANVPPYYWALYLKSLRLGQQDKSSAIPGISRDDIYAIEVPVPPLSEQRRILAKLEKLLGQVNVCQKRLAKIPLLLKRFRQSVLAAACSGNLTVDWRDTNGFSGITGNPVDSLGDFPLLPESWQWQSLESLCEKIVDCPHSTPRWTAEGRICVRTTNFQPNSLDLSHVRFVSDETFRNRNIRLRPEPGDILYSREGGILGIACMIPSGVEVCLGQRMMLLRTKRDVAGALLMYWLNSPHILRRVVELTGGSASPHLNVRDIKSFPTPVPPITEQQEIVRRVVELFALADKLEARFNRAMGQIDRLTSSMLAKAFRGELVPQDPNDEPASVLLEKIKGDPKANGSTTKRRQPIKTRARG